LLSIAHYILFRVLDGKDSSINPVLSQSRVTVISLLLVTAFRAFLLTALGTSFAQSMWFLLRSKALPVSLIESLFWIRRNIFELANPKIARQAPILLLAAVVYWAVSIAIIYPPGALIVQSEQFSYMTGVNASVMNPRPDPNTREITWPFLNGLAEVWVWGTEFFDFPTGTGSTGNFSTKYSYEVPEIRLQRIVKLGMITGQIVTLAPLGTLNSSHSFSFAGPQLRCRNLPNITTTKDIQGDAYHHESVFNITWLGARSKAYEVFPIKITLSAKEVKGYFLALNQSAPAKLESYGGPDNRTMSLVIEESLIECDAYQANISVDFRYESGVQLVKYNADVGSKLLFQTDLRLPQNATKDGGILRTSKEYLEWAPNVLQWNHIASCYAILEAVGKSLTYNWNTHFTVGFGENVGTYRLSNGSDIAIREVRRYRDGGKEMSKL
jgi:hypothetical protein